MQHIARYIALLAALVIVGNPGASAQNATVSPSKTPPAAPPQAPPNAPTPATRLNKIVQRAEPGPSSNLARPGGAPGGDALSDEQRNKLREASEKLRAEQQPQYSKMRDIRKEMAELEKAEKIDETKIREKARELGAVEGELAVLRARHFQTIKAHLPKEQVDRMREGGPANRFAPGAGGPVVTPLPGAIRPGGQVPPPGTAPQPVPLSPDRKSAPPNP